MKKAVVLMIMILVLGLAVGSAFADTYDVVKKRGSMICGVKDSTPPFGYVDQKSRQIVGYDIEQEIPWSFIQTDTFASKGQKLIYHGPLKPLEKVLLQSPLVPWSFFASNFYHNVYWYPFVGRKRVEAALQTRWGQLFKSYGDGQVTLPGMEPKTVLQAAVGLTALAMMVVGVVSLLRRR